MSWHVGLNGHCSQIKQLSHRSHVRAAAAVAVVITLGALPVANAVSSSNQLKVWSYSSTVVAVSGSGFPDSADITVTAAAVDGAGNKGAGSLTLMSGPTGSVLMGFTLPSAAWQGKISVTARSGGITETGSISFSPDASSTTVKPTPTTAKSTTTTTAKPPPTAVKPGVGGTVQRLSGLTWMSGATNQAPIASLRGRATDIAVTFEDGSGQWAGTRDPFALRAGNELSNYPGKIALAIPMLATGSSDTLSACAAGAYNDNFTALGNKLKSEGRTDTDIRLGWEGNGSWYQWSVKGNPTGWKQCFQQESRALKAVVPTVTIDWNMNKDGFDATQMYPGDAYVDVVGVDYYSQSPGVKTQSDWDSQYMKMQGSSPLGIGSWLAFAKAHNKPLAVPEWGVNDGSGGSGDSPVFIQNMFNFFKTNASNIAYEAYFNSQCPTFCLTAGKNPQSAAMYAKLYKAG